jgi:hypothetical protein
MGLLSWLTGTRPTEATDETPVPSGTGERGDIFSRLIHVPSRNFAGISSQSPTSVSRLHGSTEILTNPGPAAICCSMEVPS